MFDTMMNYFLMAYVWVIEKPWPLWAATGCAILWTAGFIMLVKRSSVMKPQIPGAPDGQPLFAIKPTRRQDLDEVCAGRLTWDEYLERHRFEVADGSLRADEKRAEKAAKPMLTSVWFDGEKQKFELTYMDELGKVTPRQWKLLGDTRKFWPKNHPGLAPETTTLRRPHNGLCPSGVGFHAGQRISTYRLRKGTGEVYQPSKREWVYVKDLSWQEHPCCPDIVWVRSVNGKEIH